MPDQSDVRRIALALPETTEGDGQFSFSVRNKDKQKGFVWVWMERHQPKQPRVPNPDVLAVRVADQDVKQFFLDADSDKFFTEPHYNGFPAILVRLPNVSIDELTMLIVEAWRCQAPRALVADLDRTQSSPPAGRKARPRRTPDQDRVSRSHPSH